MSASQPNDAELVVFDFIRFRQRQIDIIQGWIRAHYNGRLFKSISDAVYQLLVIPMNKDRQRFLQIFDYIINNDKYINIESIKYCIERQIDIFRQELSELPYEKRRKSFVSLYLPFCGPKRLLLKDISFQIYFEFVAFDIKQMYNKSDFRDNLSLIPHSLVDYEGLYTSKKEAMLVLNHCIQTII